jgi:hypothetical protein
MLPTLPARKKSPIFGGGGGGVEILDVFINFWNKEILLILENIWDKADM